MRRLLSRTTRSGPRELPDRELREAWREAQRSGDRRSTRRLRRELRRRGLCS